MSVARLLAGVEPGVPLTLARHREIHGHAPSRRRGRSPAARADFGLVEEIDRAGLLGRGGAAFPTAVKLDALAHARGPKIIIANAMEGEPGSFKDRALLEHAPHLVIDGICAASAATGAGQAIVCVGGHGEHAARSLRRALAERRDARQSDVPIRLARLQDGYLAGQETALVNALNGRAPVPSFLSRRLHERGVDGRPTLVQNIETLAHLALISRHGAAWYRARGTSGHPGTALITVWAPGTGAAIDEIEHGSPLRSVLRGAGIQDQGLRAILIGGYAGTWIGPTALPSLRLANEDLAAHGASMAAGVLIALTAEACAAAELSRVLSWMSEQSAHQCGPCANGLPAVAATLLATIRGECSQDPTARLAQLAALVARRGACAHPDGVSRFLLSALGLFAEDLQDHARYGPCGLCRSSANLPIPAPREQSPARKEHSHAR